MASTTAARARAGDGGSERAALHDRLDTLWIRYLALLDEYTTAQACIKSHMAAGFFALAQANFQAPRRRYGRDAYDERAVATTTAEFRANEDSAQLQIVKADPTNAEHARDDGASPTEHGNDEPPSAQLPKAGARAGGDEPTHLPSPEPTPEPASIARDRAVCSGVGEKLPLGERPHTAPERSPELQTALPDPQDPIRWFGILVPQALRSAQKSFSSAVLHGDTMAKAANASRAMRAVEAEIRQLRKAVRKAEKGGVSAVGGAEVNS